MTYFGKLIVRKYDLQFIFYFIFQKGFPPEATLDQVQELCSKYGKVENIVMRRLRDKEKTFKVSRRNLFIFNVLTVLTTYNS